MTTPPEPAIPTLIPDLSQIPADRLAELDSPVLANAIRTFRERLKENGIPLSSFNARI